MKVGRDSSFVEFTRNDWEETGDYWLTVSVEKDGFTGVVGEVWLSPDNVNNFIRDLALLERDRTENAKLENYVSEPESGPLDFEIRKIDSFGHLGVFVTLRRVISLRRAPELLPLNVCFELDREFLAPAINNFKKLFSL